MEQAKAYKSFTELDVWQAARHFKNGIYELTKKLPDSEKYRLQDQIVRASRSIGANVAEGYGRFTYKDQLRFCMNARGSLFEVHNHLIDAYDCEYILIEVMNDYKERILNLEKLLNGYIAWLKRMSEAKQ